MLVRVVDAGVLVGTALAVLSAGAAEAHLTSPVLIIPGPAVAVRVSHTARPPPIGAPHTRSFEARVDTDVGLRGLSPRAALGAVADIAGPALRGEADGVGQPAAVGAVRVTAVVAARLVEATGVVVVVPRPLAGEATIRTVIPVAPSAVSGIRVAGEAVYFEL